LRFFGSGLTGMRRISDQAKILRSFVAWVGAAKQRMAEVGILPAHANTKFLVAIKPEAILAWCTIVIRLAARDYRSLRPVRPPEAG
jgi:hypothetical protein